MCISVGKNIPSYVNNFIRGNDIPQASDAANPMQKLIAVKGSTSKPIPIATRLALWDAQRERKKPESNVDLNW